MNEINYKIYFSEPYQVMVKTGEMHSPGKGQVLVRSEKSAISAGTEMLVYRGQFPENIQIDETIPELAAPVKYPMQYGYSIVGNVTQTGIGVPETLLGKRVFLFSPHQTYTITSPDQLILIPDDISDLDALFYSNMETAINLVQDANPMIGEKTAVIGLGIVGLLTLALLKRFPLDQLVAVDKLAFRQSLARQLGIEDVYGIENHPEQSSEIIHENKKQSGYDLILECSGSPAGLQSAIDMARFSGRIVVGSWYGNKPVQLELGSRFHRRRLQLISSQVSTISPGIMARWDKSRRGELTWKMIGLVNPSRWITNTYSIQQAELAYQLIDQNPEQIMQVVFDY